MSDADADAGDEHAPIARAPTPRERAEGFARRFVGTANGIALQFGGPVYLVGSFLTSDTPGDIDIRCVVDPLDAEALFGADERPVADLYGWSEARMRRAREGLKQSRRLTRRWSYRAGCRARIDFQIEVCAQWAFEMDDLDKGPPRPRIRLDAVPDAYFAAGRGDP